MTDWDKSQEAMDALETPAKRDYAGKWHLDSTLNMNETAKPLAMQVGQGLFWSNCQKAAGVAMINHFQWYWADLDKSLLFYDKEGDLFTIAHPSIDPRTLDYQMLWDAGIRSWSWGLP